MSAHFIEEKLEDAFAAALLTEHGGTLVQLGDMPVTDGGTISGGALDGFNLYKGFSLGGVEPPFISTICARSGPEDKPPAAFTGNQACELDIGVLGHKGDTTRTAHASNVGHVRDLMYASNLVDLMNAAGVAALTVLFARPGPAVRDTQFGMLKTSQKLRILCRPS